MSALAVPQPRSFYPDIPVVTANIHSGKALNRLLGLCGCWSLFDESHAVRFDGNQTLAIK